MCTRVSELVAFIRSLPQRSIRQTVELVINGDFVDFLAEQDDDAGSGPSGACWRPFIISPDKAVRVFRRIAKRDAALFDALRRYLCRGGRLTLLLGNHDVELSLPAVRRELESVLDSDGRDLAFVYDGEAYRVGPVLIEHGNRYDRWNVVPHDALRRLRSSQSRGEEQKTFFDPPAGSHLVAGVLNQIKKDFPFVDLLKPENESVLPILLALAPEYRRHIFAVARLAARAHLRPYDATVSAATRGDMATTSAPLADGRRVVEQALQAMLAPQDVAEFIRDTLGNDIDTASLDGDMGSGRKASSVWGWM